MSNDLQTPIALVALDTLLTKGGSASAKRFALSHFDNLLGLDLLNLSRADLRVRPVNALIEEATIEAKLAERKEARAAKDFARSDAIRDDLTAAGVEVMDGDPLGWEWKVTL